MRRRHRGLSTYGLSVIRQLAPWLCSFGEILALYNSNRLERTLLRTATVHVEPRPPPSAMPEKRQTGAKPVGIVAYKWAKMQPPVKIPHPMSRYGDREYTTGR